MKRKAEILGLVLMMFLAVNQIIAKTDDCQKQAVEVTQVKEIGLSDSDETKSVIEVKWCVNQAIQPAHSGFNVTVEVIYADGAILIFDEQSKNQVRSTQIEVPTLHIYRGKKPAIIKQIRAFVTAEILD